MGGTSTNLVYYYVYVLKSLNHNRFYIGFTSNLEKRLYEHNHGKTRSNKAFAPFQIIYSEKFDSRENARKREKYLKSGAGRKFLTDNGIK